MDVPREAEAQVERLLELSSTGPYVLAELLDACVAHLRAVEEARTALGRLPSEEVRAAIARRRAHLFDGGHP